MSGSYGTPGKPRPDPKQPVTSMDTASAEAAASAARDLDATEVPDGAEAPWPEDPGTPAGPDLRDLPSNDTARADGGDSTGHGDDARA